MIFRIDGLGYKGFYVTENHQILPEGLAVQYPYYPTINSGSEWAIIGEIENSSYHLLSMQPPLKDFKGHAVFKENLT